MFRSGDMDSVLAQIKKIVVTPSGLYSNRRFTQEDIDYAFKLHSAVTSMSNFELRVESPWISFYTNNLANIELLTALDETKVKYISAPPANQQLASDNIIMPKMNYDYRITIGKTITEHSAFVQWAENSDKLRLTKSCRKDLLKQRSWGGTYFYVTGDNTLLMAKMHLGGSIAKIERIIKA
jgi:hypothetical protein